MLFNLPESLQYFFQIIFKVLMMSPEQRQYTKATVCAILFAHKKISMSVIGSILAPFQRHKSSVSRMFSNTYFATQEVAWMTVKILCSAGAKQTPIGQKERPWLLVFDSTHRTRFGKLLQNLIGTHGEKSKKRSYAFVWGMLITPTGIRIPLPCKMWISPEYAEENNMTHQTQPQLVGHILSCLNKTLTVANMRFDLVIVADSAFECDGLRKICDKHNSNINNTLWTLITTCDVGRCLGSSGAKATRLPGQKVLDVMKQQPLLSTKRIDIQALTGIALRSRQKFQAQKAGEISSTAVYTYYQKQLRVANIGDTNVVLSYKHENSSLDEKNASFRLLLCNNLHLSAEEIIAYYSMRWEIETFFREQKSHLAFRDFEACDPLACEKFTDLLTVSFNFLEFYRLQLIDNPDPVLVKSQESFNWMRTKELKQTFIREANADSIIWLLERSKTPFGVRRIRESLFKLMCPLKIFKTLQEFVG